MNKNSLKSVYLFIGGAVVYSIALPLLETVGNLIQSAINCRIGRMQMDMEEQQCEHEAACEIIKPTEKNPTAAIGFDYQGNEEEDYYDDE
jgi:hypothetical protein